MPTTPQLPNSTWTASANATWTATSLSGDPSTSNRMSLSKQTSVSLPPWPVSNSTTSIWATGSAISSTDTVTSETASSTSTPIFPPWPTHNSTTASITGTLSIPVIPSSVIIGTDITRSVSTSFPWTNVTSRPSTGVLTASVIIVTGGVTITLQPTGTSLISTTAVPSLTINGTVLQTSTPNAPFSHTSAKASRTLASPFPTGNLTLVPGPTDINTSRIPLSTAMSGTGGITVSSSLSAILPPFPTANSTRMGTLTISNSAFTLISTLTGLPSTLFSSVTGTPASRTLPPFPTTNSTLMSGPTGSGTEVSHTASGTVFQTREPVETPTGTPLITIPQSFPTGFSTVVPGPTVSVSITASGSVVSNLTITRSSGSITEIVTIITSSVISPPFPTSIGTVGQSLTGTLVGTGVTRTSSGTGGPFFSPTVIGSTWGQWPNTTSSSTLSATGGSTLPSGTVFATTSPNASNSSVLSRATSTRSIFNSTISRLPTISSAVTGILTNISATPSKPFTSVPPFANATTIAGEVPTTHLTWTLSGTIFHSVSILPVSTLSPISSSISTRTLSGTAPTGPTETFVSVSRVTSAITDSRLAPLPSFTISDQPNITNPTGLPSVISTPCHTVTITNGTITQIVTRSVLITTATASADPTLVYPPSANGTILSASTSCTSKWKNTTTSAAGFKSTWTSFILTNRTSSLPGSATTFITSKTSRLGDPNRGNSGLPAVSNFVVGTPTTTITDAPLPSNSAYPWGGLGPVFRHHDESSPVTADGSANKPMDPKANGAWWARWKRHSDRLTSLRANSDM
ncbi:hypothetical protein CH63R_09903 [Colletotrichum higginsianum IMI 349063]|uniref:Uncharacterized protein n=1 Tax=Colletotrichum higginsianum (strain IMI 349063) TaxID=759273 RepID=A0A1B7Y183_COLHI|nr:uncharacterized protein CH63R_09903 [Colletotrichum higginsianum IMI 349063]OBR05783.1 hypothetical protein CH63R_09903 [Colletotrichum higginsianum IMI 349063]